MISVPLEHSTQPDLVRAKPAFQIKDELKCLVEIRSNLSYNSEYLLIIEIHKGGNEECLSQVEQSVHHENPLFIFSLHASRVSWQHLQNPQSSILQAA